MYVWIWLICLLAALILWLRQTYNYFEKKGIKSLTLRDVMSSLWRGIFYRDKHFTENIIKYYQLFIDQRFYGAFQITKPVLVVKDIELIKKISIKDFEYFLDHNSTFSQDQNSLFGRSLISLQGQEWKDMRSTLSPAFTSSKMKMMLPLMVEVGDQMMLSLKKKIKESEEGYVDIDAKDLMTRYANDVIASCAFGLKVNSHVEEDNEFYVMGKMISTFKLSQLLKVMVLLAFPRLARMMKLKLFPDSLQNFFRRLVLETMENRQLNNIIRPDMIHLLMEAKKGKLTHDKATQDQDAGFATVEEFSVGKKETDRVWSDDDLTAQAMLFFAAGFETVSSAMSFLLYELAVNTDVQDRLYQEIRENEERNNGRFDYNSIQNMVYMDMVVSETLRKWPPAVVLDRECNKKYNAGRANAECKEDYIINKGDIVQIPMWAIHRDPQFFPNPDKFDPERFSEENKHNIQPFTYMPFGLGPRNCIGSRFALCEVKVMAYQLLLNFEVSPSDKTIIPAVLDPSSFNIKMKGGHWTRFMARKDV